MSRKSFDQWKIPLTTYNRGTVFYVECDCGELAKKVYLKLYFDCPKCKNRYALSRGQFIEIKKKN